MDERENYELAAAFAGVGVEVLGLAEELLEESFEAVASVLTGAESLLDSPELSLTVLDPLRLSVR